MTAFRQFSRYVAIGIGTNALLYAAYLAMTALGLVPTVAMSVIYISGVFLSYFLNRRWSFQSTQPHGRTLGRYVALYASGYVLNYVGLAQLPGLLGLPHQLVQIGLMGGLVAYFFLLMRVWVFRPVATAANGGQGA